MWGLSRIHQGLLSAQEQRLIRYLLPRLPGILTPDILSLLALIGAALAGASIVLSWYSPLGIAGFALGLALHWFGDSCDGALARYRKIEKPKAGLLIDRSADILSFCFIIFGLGMSPYLSFIPALLLFIGVLMNAIYTILLSITEKKQVVGLGGLGGTEGRIFLVLWVICWHMVGGMNATPPVIALGPYELLSFGALCLAVSGFALGMVKRIKYYAALEATKPFATDSEKQLSPSDDVLPMKRTAKPYGFVEQMGPLGQPANMSRAYRPVKAGRRTR